MSKRWWSPFEGMEQIAFKPVAEGYLYRAPNPWLFGPGRYYLVNEAQKTELAARHRSMLNLTFWLIIATVAVGVPFAGMFFPGQPWITLGVSALVGLAIGLAVNLQLLRQISPMLPQLQPTTGRITQRDAFKMQTTVFSPRTVIGFAILDCALFALVVSSALFGANGWDLYAITGTLLFGFGAAYFIALYVAQRRRAV